MKRLERWDGVSRESATDGEHRCLGGVSFYWMQLLIQKDRFASEVDDEGHLFF